jgi:gluconokinase
VEAADRALLASRLAQRAGHYMPASLLDSQLATLDPPSDQEALIVDAGLPIAEQVSRVLARYGLT